MVKHPDDDLFKDTSMTFGEHLDELRQCLFKALIGLVMGFLIGLIFGKDIVGLIASPMEGALQKFYTEEVTENLRKTLQERGVESAEIDFEIDRVRHIIVEDELLFDYVYYDAEDLLADLQAKYPSALTEVKLPSDRAMQYEDIVELKDELAAIYAVALDKKEIQLPEEPADYAGNQQMLDALRAANPGLLDNASLPVRKTDMIGMLLWHPMTEDERIRLSTLNAHEAFMIYLKASLLGGALLASPWVFYQIWAFVAAGLYRHEKRYIHIFLPFSLGLFLSGFGFAFLLVFEPVLNFLFGFNRAMGIAIEPRISEWLSFVMFLPLGFGVAFQLPLAMLFMERIGLFTVEIYLEKWRLSVLVICVLSMLLTPADPYSMLLMAAPLTGLYFLAILLCKYIPKRRSPIGDA